MGQERERDSAIASAFTLPEFDETNTDFDICHIHNSPPHFNKRLANGMREFVPIAPYLFHDVLPAAATGPHGGSGKKFLIFFANFV